MMGVIPSAYPDGMPLELPTSLSPSKVSTFTDCALAFRFSSIDKLPEPPSIPATKGTLVHAALERLFDLAADDRTVAAALTALDQAMNALRDHPTSTSRIPARSPPSASSSSSRHRSATCGSAASSTGSSSTPRAAWW
jgi:hypothetical protein